MLLLAVLLVACQVASAAPVQTFTAPGDITVTQVNKNSAVLTWKPVADAPGYRVRILAAGKKTRYVSTATSTVKLTGLSKNTAYTVSAFVVDPTSKTPTDALSEDSPQWPVQTSTQSRFSPDDLNVVKQTPTSVAVSWDPVQGIQPDEKYMVEYALDFEMTMSRHTVGPFTATSGTIKKLPTNTTWYAKVYVVDAKNKRVSGSSDLVTAKSLVPRGAIAGKVSGHTGSDVVATAYIGEEAGDSVTVGSDGAYTLRVRPGSYRVEVRSTEPGNVVTRWAKSGSSGGRTFSEAGKVTVVEDETVTAPTVHLGGGGKVDGSVRGPGKNSDVIPNVDVTALSDFTASEREVIARDESSKSGGYGLAGMPDGQYWLRFRYTGDGFRIRSINVVLKDGVVVAVQDPKSKTWQRTTSADPFTSVNAHLDLADFRRRYGASVKGSAKVGSKVHVKAYPWLAGDFPTTRARMTFQWKRNGATIGGADGSSYRLTKADRGKKISVVATASRYGYRTGSVTSKAVKVH